jgi:hypothetical protein
MGGEGGRKKLSQLTAIREFFGDIDEVVTLPVRVVEAEGKTRVSRGQTREEGGGGEEGNALVTVPAHQDEASLNTIRA